MGVSNHWTGEWTGMVEWIMELTISYYFYTLSAKGAIM